MISVEGMSLRLSGRKLLRHRSVRVATIEVTRALSTRESFRSQRREKINVLRATRPDFARTNQPGGVADGPDRTHLALQTAYGKRQWGRGEIHAGKRQYR